MNKYKDKEVTEGFVRDKWEKRTDAGKGSMRVRIQSRVGEKGSEEEVIHRRCCLKDFPGSIGKSTDSETHQIPGITMAERKG